MKIERIKIEGDRSLYDVTIEPKPLMVLIGPNNAGKSNVVVALSFLSQAYSTPQGLERAIVARGGWGIHPSVEAAREPGCVRCVRIVSIP